MSKTDVSRRKFLGRSGALALTLPLAAAIPAAIEVASPKKVGAAVVDVRQGIPNRVLPTRAIPTQSYTVPNMPTNGTDCAQAINDAIAYVVTQYGGGTVIIPWHNTGGNQCVYMLNPMFQQDGTANCSGTTVPVYCGIKLASYVRLQFKPGVKIQAMPVTQSPVVTNRAYMVYGHQINDVEIANGWFVGERYTHVYSGLCTGTDEWCHGFQLLGVTGITIRGTLISDCTGDGICIGNIGSATPSDNVLCDVVSTGNRRQALSITSGNSISVYDSEFSYTSGTAPGDGIDIEPQGSTSVTNLTIENCVIKGNSGDGIQLNAAGTTISNVTVKNCMVSYNYYNGFSTQNSNGGIIDTGMVIGNAFFQNGNYGLQLGGTTTHYTVGGGGSNGTNSNSFADNQNLYNSIVYPDLTQTNTQGYVSGTDMNLSANSLLASSNNLIDWNSYFTP